MIMGHLSIATRQRPWLGCLGCLGRRSVEVDAESYFQVAEKRRILRPRQVDGVPPLSILGNRVYEEVGSPRTSSNNQ